MLVSREEIGSRYLLFTVKQKDKNLVEQTKWTQNKGSFYIYIINEKKWKLTGKETLSHLIFIGKSNAKSNSMKKWVTEIRGQNNLRNIIEIIKQQKLI